MKKFKILILIKALLLTNMMVGQQDPQYSQYTYNMNVINPAYAGSKGVLSMAFLGRNQWVGVEGAPKTITLSANAPIARAVGLGISAINDRIGPVNQTNAYIDLSYTVVLSEVSRLALGIKGGFSNYQLRPLSTGDPNDPSNISFNKTTPNIGAGLYFYTDKFYAGLSSPNFIETSYLEKNAKVVARGSQKMHYFLTSGYVMDIYDNLKFKPSTMLRFAEGSPLSLDISANFLWEEKFEFGGSLRLNESLSAMVAFLIDDNLRVGYSYDMDITRFGTYNSGSHEFMIIIDLNKRNLKSPRFF